MHLENLDAAKVVKTAPTSIEAVNLGYASEQRGYHVYIPSLTRFTVAHPTKFVDEKYLDVPELTRAILHTRKQKRAPATAPATSDRDDAADAEANENVVLFNGGSVGEPYHMCLNAIEPDDVGVPNSYSQAIDRSNPYRDLWIEAMQDEIAGKQANGPLGTYSIVPRAEMEAEHRKTMKCKWVYTLKRAMNGSIERFKARIVGCGYSQIQGIDYEFTFASTIRGTTVRCFFAEAAACDLVLVLIDVVKAFTHASMTERLFIDLPKGFEVDGCVGLLHQALEGTKQAAHLWQQLLTEVLTRAGMTRSTTDPNLFVMIKDGFKMLIIVWVDDLAVAHNDYAKFDAFYAAISQQIKCTRKELDKFIGIEVTRDRKNKTLTLRQSLYLDTLAKKHLAVSESKEWKHVTPCGTSKAEAVKFINLREAENETEKRVVVDKGYLSVLGALMYSACMTMPDIMYHCSRLAALMHNPSTDAYEALLGVLHYSYHRRDIGLTFGGKFRASEAAVKEDLDFAPEIVGDASFGGAFTHPFAGGFIRWRNAAVVWLARKLKFVPQSSCEAETAAAVAMCKEAIFVADVLEFMGVKVQLPMPLLTDSKSAHDIIQNPGATKHTIHFMRWLHFARELWLKRYVNVYLVTTDRMMADDKTKPVEKGQFLKCRKAQLNLPD